MSWHIWLGEGEDGFSRWNMKDFQTMEALAKEVGQYLIDDVVGIRVFSPSQDLIDEFMKHIYAIWGVSPDRFQQVEVLDAAAIERRRRRAREADAAIAAIKRRLASQD